MLLSILQILYHIYSSNVINQTKIIETVMYTFLHHTDNRIKRKQKIQEFETQFKLIFVIDVAFRVQTHKKTG